MKVMLVFPPQWTPAMPHLALPVLTSALRRYGVDVVQRDLNLETYETVLTRAYLLQRLDQLKAQHPPSARATREGRERAGSDLLGWAHEEGPRLAARVEAAVEVFRSPAFYDGERSLEAFLTIAQALDVVSLLYSPATFDLLRYEPGASVDSSRDLLQAARDERRNMFADIFRRGILQDIASEQPGIVGISIPTRAQMLPAMTLARLIKEAGLGAHVTVGGPHISMLREQLPTAPGLFHPVTGLIDSAVVFEGETPLLRLAEALDGGGNLADIPNLIYRSGDEVRVNPAEPKRRSDALPDFDGLPLGRYLAPDLVLPLITAHGCYHGRCAFCNVGYGTDRGFHALPVEQVLDQVNVLRHKYDSHHVFFADEAIPPRTLRKLSSKLAEQGGPVNWCGCARFDHALSESLLNEMAAGGCRMLLFGLETGSERMIRQMVKGTEAETMSRILSASAQAGIWNHAFFFFGFPTETMKEAQETVNFLYAQQEALHSASPGVFVLERFSPVHADPARFGVRKVAERAGQDLAIYFDYEPGSGLDERMARTIVERLVDTFPAKRYGQYYLNDVNRFLYASYLHKLGKPYPLWLADEAT